MHLNIVKPIENLGLELLKEIKKKFDIMIGANDGKYNTKTDGIGKVMEYIQLNFIGKKMSHKDCFKEFNDNDISVQVVPMALTDIKKTKRKSKKSVCESYTKIISNLKNTSNNTKKSSISNSKKNNDIKVPTNPINPDDKAKDNYGEDAKKKYEDCEITHRDISKLNNVIESNNNKNIIEGEINKNIDHGKNHYFAEIGNENEVTSSDNANDIHEGKEHINVIPKSKDNISKIKDNCNIDSSETIGKSNIEKNNEKESINESENEDKQPEKNDKEDEIKVTQENLTINKTNESDNKEEIKTPKKTKKKQKNKKNNKTVNNEKKEYEELKMNALKYFSALTQSTTKSKSKKHKKQKKSAVENQTIKTEEQITEYNNTKEVIEAECEVKVDKEPITEERSNWKRPPWPSTRKYKNVTYRKKQPTYSYSEEKAQAISYDIDNTTYFSDISNENIIKLNEEIDKVLLHLKSHNNEVYKAYEVVSKVIKEQANKIFVNDPSKGEIQVNLYGSVATGLALDESDIDITLGNITAISLEDYMNNFLTFGKHLKELPFIKNSKIIPTARVPVIKLVTYI